jgi:hypothetical protein
MRKGPLAPRLKYPWQQAVFDAVIEYHADRMRDKITAAERAISGRLLERPTDLEELVALREALIAMEMVFPETKPKVEVTENKESA